METQEQVRERIAAKIAAAKWPDDVPQPAKKPKLKLSGRDGNGFFILVRAQAAARDKGKWTARQIESFMNIARAGDYDHLLRTCMTYFDVS